ncbi:hypothetical protein ACFT38_27765 [Streptomyces sp. NPDC056975]|uniref:hypothetical protein n=1 Tax=Streptomyces sp. NPDC056975 TaxID=3345985 RepID=UPI00362675EE
MRLEVGGDVFDQAEQLRLHGLGIGVLGEVKVHPGDADADLEFSPEVLLLLS